jgi:hypothetical protein
MGYLGEVLSNFRNSIVDEKSKIKNKLESLENRIEENLKIAKYIIPSALMATLSSNTYGRIGYYGSQAFIYSRMAKENADAGHLMYGKTPLMVGAITGAAGFIIGILVGDIYKLHISSLHLPNVHTETHHVSPNSTITSSTVTSTPSSVTNYNNSTIYEHNNITNNITIYEQNNITVCKAPSVTNYSNSTISKLENEINNLQNQLNQDNIKISELEDELRNATNTINIYQKLLNQDNQTIAQYNSTIANLNSLLQRNKQELSQYNQTIYNLQNQLQLLQKRQTLEEILFGNSSNDISVIKINSVNIANGDAIIKGIAYPSGDKVTLEIPISYVENNGVTIQNLYSVSQQYGWNSYIALDRADLQYLILNNRNGTPIIDIQSNEPINIGVYSTLVNSSTLSNVLDHLANYNSIFQDSYTVYNNPNALWGYNDVTKSSVVIDFSSNYQYNLAKEMVNIADEIINSPNNQNPTASGIIDTYSIFKGTMSTYQTYPQYNVGQTYIPLIVLKPQQGNTIPDAVSS